MAGLADATVAKRVAGDVACRLGFPPDRVAEAVLVASELAHNHVAHRTCDGMLRISGCQLGGTPCLMIASLDGGPGIADIAAVLGGGLSTEGGLGAGVGTVVRLSDQLSLCSGTRGPFSCPGVSGPREYATLVCSTLWPRRMPPQTLAAAGVDLCALVRPRGGDAPSGDAVFVQADDQYVRITLIDAAGHGHEAAGLCRAASGELDRLALLWPPHHVVDSLDSTLRGGRGVAIEVMLFDLYSRTLKCAGAGNIKTIFALDRVWFTADPRGGALGSRTWERVAGREYGPCSDVLAVMHTDGHRQLRDMERNASDLWCPFFVYGGRNLRPASMQGVPAGLLTQILFDPKPNQDAALVVWRWAEK